MLNKVKLGIVIAAVLTILRVIFTDVVWTEGLGEALVLVIVFFSQFFIKETKETVAKLRLKTRGGTWVPGSWMFTLMFVLMLPASVFGQGYDKTRGRPEAEKADAKVELQIERVAFGVGAFFNQPSFSKNMLFGSVQLHGVGLPFIREGASTGIALEGHMLEMFTTDAGNVAFQPGNLSWRVWSITRVPIAAIPISALKSGTPSRMFLIADVLLHEAGPVDWTDGFEARVGFGGDLGILGPGNLVIEVYMFQQDIPVAVNFVYGF